MIPAAPPRCSSCRGALGHTSGCRTDEAVEWRLRRVRDSYVAGDLTVEEIEASVAHVLAGGAVGPSGLPSEYEFARVELVRGDGVRWCV